jgi:hypothetical protein
MVGAADQKTSWNLAETVVWICTRDHDRVAGMWDLSEFEAIALAFFHRQQLPQREIRRTAPGDDGGVRADAAGVVRGSAAELPAASAAAGQLADDARGRQASSISDDRPSLDQILRNVMRKIQTGKVRMTLIKDGENGVERLPVSTGEANDLELRLTEDGRSPVVAWSRTRQDKAGISPWFSRPDVLRAWPERLKKTAAVTGAVLRHLREITTAERPLTRDEATTRCLTEVPNAYPEAVRKAWAQLEPSRKRGRGKHGPKAH